MKRTNAAPCILIVALVALVLASVLYTSSTHSGKRITRSCIAYPALIHAGVARIDTQGQIVLCPKGEKR